MRNYLRLILIICVCQSAQFLKGQGTTANFSATDNKELISLFHADQIDRKSTNIDWPKIIQRDKERQAKVYELLAANQVITAQDYYHAAMIFQHGMDTLSSGMAVKMIKKSLELDDQRSKWLLAAAIDRDLKRKGRPQIYGTQYFKRGPDAPWELYEIDTTQVTDEERIAFDVRTLSEQRQKVNQLNKKQLSDLFNKGKKISEIVSFVEQDLQNSNYDLSEMAINRFGYQLSREGKTEDALKIFEMNVRLFPDAYNTYDSLGECLMKLGRVNEGLNAYKKSLELNPNNEGALQVLEEFKK